MNTQDDMLCRMAAKKPSALDRYIERKERDDSVEKAIERIRARSQRIRRIYGLPERDYPSIESIIEDRSLY